MSGFTAPPPFYSVHSRYLQYDVAGDQFCGRLVTVIDTVTSEFSFSCCYFELHE